MENQQTADNTTPPNTGFAPVNPEIENALDFVEAIPIETSDLKVDKVISGIYQERKSIGQVPVPQAYGGGYREAFVHVMLDIQTKMPFQIWDKGGLNYQIKMCDVKKDDIIRITRLVDVVNEDKTKYSQYKIEKAKN